MVDRDPHTTADRIPQFGGSSRPWIEGCPENLRPCSILGIFSLPYETIVPLPHSAACECKLCRARASTDDFDAARQARFPDLGPPPVFGGGQAPDESAKRKSPVHPFRNWPPLWAGLALLCLLPLLGGCQFIAYQHFDYRVQHDRAGMGCVCPSDGRSICEEQRPDDNPSVGNTFPGMFGLSPGIEDLARLAGPDCWVAHSAGAARAIRELLDGADPPRVLILIDPWPLRLEIPDGPELVIVVCGRPSVVTVAPGTRAVSKLRAAGACPWAWTIGHLYACRWPESVEAAREAATVPAITPKPKKPQQNL